MSSPDPRPFDALAAILRYPDDGYARRVASCVEALTTRCGAAADEVRAFARETEDLRPAKREELFTRSFDLDPMCSLDLGWHLFGEAYARGRFLVTVRGLLRSHGVAESVELPDHLSHVLPLLGRMDHEAAGQLARQAVLPALLVMEKAFAESDNPYRHILSATRALVDETFIAGTAEACHD